MDDGRSDRGIVCKHGVVYGEGAGNGKGEFGIPGEATKKSGEGMGIRYLATLLHLSQASASDCTIAYGPGRNLPHCKF